jgi:hypothetical protein
MEGLREGQGNESLEPAEVERVVGFVMQAIEGDVRRIAEAMVLKRDDELLGPGEFDLREKMLQAASHILEATLDDRKKGGTKAAARSAHTAARTPASSSGEPKGW